MLPVFYTYLVIEHRVGGVEILDSPSLVLGQNSTLTSDDTADLRRQVIAADDDNK